MGQEDGVLEERGQKWTAAADLQPAIPKSDSLLGQRNGLAIGQEGADRRGAERAKEFERRRAYVEDLVQLAARELRSAPSTLAKAVGCLEGLARPAALSPRDAPAQPDQRRRAAVPALPARARRTRRPGVEAGGAGIAPSGTFRIEMPIVFGRRFMLPPPARLADRRPGCTDDAGGGDSRYTARATGCIYRYALHRLCSPTTVVTGRLIAHLDMDAFYASVELLRYPDLRGQPVVIGGGRDHAPQLQPDGTRRYARLRHYVGRGVITTATYAARAYGVNSGLGLMKAAALAPDAVLLPVDFDAYRKYSRLFKAAVLAVAPQIEDRGIDEIYIDLTDLPGAQEDGGLCTGRTLKDAVFAATGLTCSVGITPNKLLSKICSEFDKPDGLTLLTSAEIPARIWPLPARKINGIGPKASERLAAIGIQTIGDLAAADPQALLAGFGRSYGAWLHEAAHGRDERPVVTYSEPKSISRETTFERDLHAVRDKPALTGLLNELCTGLAGDLARKGYASKTIGIKLRFDDFRIVTRDLTLPAHTMDARSIRRAAGECLKRVDLTRRLRLLGVRAGALARLSDLVGPAGPSPAARALPARESQARYALPLFDSPSPDT